MPQKSQALASLFAGLPMLTPRLRSAVLVLLAAFVSSACGGSNPGPVTPPPPPPTVSSVTVAPGTLGLAVGATGQLAVTVTLSNGSVSTSPTVSWSSSNAAVATVGASGTNVTVTAVAPGSATITATSSGVSGTSVVTVTAPVVPVAVVIVTPPVSSIFVGDSVALAVSTRASDGSVLTGRVVTWSSSAPTRATVSNAGVVTGIATGDTVIISATSEGIVGTARVVVMPPVVSVVASDALGGESGADPAVFTISRTGPTGQPLVVTYAMSGTAQNGTDYATLSGNVTIAAGLANALVTVVPGADVLVEGPETVTLTITPSAAYAVGGAPATATIADAILAPGTLINGQNHTGRISAPGQLDTWTFTATQSETIILSVAETAGVADFTPWIRLLAPSGAVVQDNWDATAAQVWRTAPETGTYRVVIGSRDVGNDATGDYRLILVKVPGAYTVPSGDDGGTMSNGVNHTGAIPVGDLDVWSFTATQGEALVVAMAETRGDADFTPWIRLFGPDGALVQDNWDATAVQHWRAAPATGTYTVVVSTRDVGVDATGDYRLILAKSPGTFAVPQGDDGGAMTNGANHTGTIMVGDLDMWSFTATQGEALVIAMAETQGDADFTPWIRLFGPTGALVQDNWDGTAVQHWRAAPATGTYTLIVGTRDVGTDASGTYRLTLAKSPGAFTVPAGDDGGVMTNGANHTGTIPVGDLDLWSFTATQGDAIIIAMAETQGDADFTPWIRLYGPTGALVQDNWDVTAVQHWRVAPATGSYTLVVGTRDVGADASGSYQLTLALLPGSHVVGAGDQGGPIAIPGPSTGNIHVGDLDTWTFTAPQGTTFIVSMSEVSGDADFTPWIRVFGPNGALVGENWDASVTQLSRTASATGTFYVVVGTRDVGADAQGNYTLTVTGSGVSSRVAPIVAPSANARPGSRRGVGGR